MSTFELGETELAAAVAEVLGVPEVRLAAHPAGGSRAAYRVEVNGDEHAAFLRLDDGESGMSGTEFDLEREARILRSVGAAGIPVPKVLGSIAHPPATVLEYVPGRSRLELDTLDAVGADYMAWIAATHALDPGTLPVEQFLTLTDAIESDLAWWRTRAFDAGLGEVPLVRVALRWLGETVPRSDDAPRFVHGDVGPGNFLASEGKVTAVLDWEMAHVGDLHEDLAWLWMRGAHSEFGDPRRRFDDYVAAGGTDPDSDRLHWHLAFVILKTVVAIRARLRQPGRDRLVVTQDVLGLTYEALLGWVLGLLAGERRQLLAEEPVEQVTTDLRLFDRAGAALGDGDREAMIAFERLRLTAAQAPWRAERLAADIEIELGGAPLSAALIDAAELSELAAVIRVVGADADRACWTSPPALRRIRRAQRIGLGTSS